MSGPAHPSTTLSAATVVGGRFVVLAPVAKGASGAVYKARDLTDERVVALKVLLADRPFDLGRFAREAEVLSTLRHPNVVAYIAHGEDGGVRYLAQEWIEGGTLAVHLRDVGLTAQEAVGLVGGLAAALAAAHAAGVIHRDLKPSNIILAGGHPSSAKLVDFGIARQTSAVKVITRTGMMVGTPPYMAPEQARGLSRLDAPTDVWALGCVLYEALTGRMAFTGKSLAAVRAKVLLGDPPAVRSLCPEAPPALERLVEEMLRKEPGARPPDGQAVGARLASLPPIPAGPRRRGGGAAGKTAVIEPAAGHRAGGAASFVLFTHVEGGGPAASPEPPTAIQAIAERHGLDVHGFEDGSALLAARVAGREGALAAARAGVALRQGLGEVAVTVFARGGDSLDDALERGGELLEQATMTSLFGGVVGNAEPVVHVDEVIAELIAGEVRVDATDGGAVISASDW